MSPVSSATSSTAAAASAAARRSTARKSSGSNKRRTSPTLALATATALLLAGAALLASPAHAQASAKKMPGAGDRAMWVWGGVDYASESSMNKVLDFMNAPHGYKGLSINRIFLHVGTGMLSGTKATQMRNFLKLAHSKGVLVEYLDGDAQWTTSAAKSQTPKTITSQVIAFNTGTPDTADDFDGIHFDIEPHVLGSLWTSNTGRGRDSFNDDLQDTLLAIYRDCKKLIATGDPKMTLAADIGVWYVTAASDVWNGFMADQSVDYIGIMDYRDTQGPFQQGAVQNLQNVKGSIKIMVGVESIDENSAPPEQSFWQEGYGPLEKQLATTKANIQSYAGFGGFAIHHYGSYSVIPYDRRGTAGAVPSTWNSARADYPKYGGSTGTSTSTSTRTSTSTSTSTRTSTSTSTSKPTSTGGACNCRRETRTDDTLSTHFSTETSQQQQQGGSNTHLIVIAALGWGVASVGIVNMLVTERKRRAQNAALAAAM